MVVFGQKWLYSGKVVLFEQKCFSLGKVAVVGQKWLCSGKMVVFGQKCLHSVKSGCIREKVVLF